MPASLADQKAALAALWERAHGATPPGTWPLVIRLTSGPQVSKLPPGFSAFAVGDWDDQPTQGQARHIVVMPTLWIDAPDQVWHRYQARLIALGTGRCPLCNGTAHLSLEVPEPGSQRGRAAWAHLPLTVDVAHAVGCPTAFGPEDRRWFDPRAVAQEDA